jgi:hypothetical protein
MRYLVKFFLFRINLNEPMESFGKESASLRVLHLDEFEVVPKRALHLQALTIGHQDCLRSLPFLRIEHPAIKFHYLRVLTGRCSERYVVNPLILNCHSIPQLATLYAVWITNQGAFDKAESTLWHDGHIGGHEINMLGRENTSDFGFLSAWKAKSRTFPDRDPFKRRPTSVPRQ